MVVGWTLVNPIQFFLCNKIWEEEKVLKQWTKGSIVKLPKKGDLTQSSKGRFITLLSVPGNVLCRIMLNKMKGEMDTILKKNKVNLE